MFRLLLLMLFASMAMVVARAARRTIARSGSATIRSGRRSIGLLAEVMFLPVLVLTCVVLAISVVGIPLLLLVPFVISLHDPLALVGFTGTALAVGQWARRQFSLGRRRVSPTSGSGSSSILFPVLVGRLVGLGGFLTGPIVFLLVGAGLGLEFLGVVQRFWCRADQHVFALAGARRATKNES